MTRATGFGLTDPPIPSHSELEAILQVLPEAMESRGGAATLFLTGSAVTGEWAARETDEGWVFFSDLDIGVVREVRDPGFERTLREDIAGRLRELAGPRRWRELPLINIAFFTRQELSLQSPKPGTLEMISQGQVLWGDRSIRDHFPPLTAEDLTWEEAIRLLGNRVLELLASPPGEKVDLVDYFRISKLYCDFATALLIPEGAYVSGYRKRADRLPSLLNDRPLPPKLNRLKNRMIDSVEFWTEFRTYPGLEILRERYGDVDPIGEEGRGLLCGIWCEARALMEACLGALMPHRLLDERGEPSPEAMSRTSGWGTWRHRVREWRWLARYAPESAARIWHRGIRLAFRLSPVEITYLIGFILFVRSVDGPPPCYLDEDLLESLERWYPLPHQGWTSGEEVRQDLLRLWRYWLPRI